MSLWGRSPHFQVTSKYAHASTERSESACHVATNAKLSGHFGRGGGKGGTHAFFFNNNAKKCVESLLIIWTILTNQIVESSQNVLANRPPLPSPQQPKQNKLLLLGCTPFLCVKVGKDRGKGGRVCVCVCVREERERERERDDR